MKIIQLIWLGMVVTLFSATVFSARAQSANQTLPNPITGEQESIGHIYLHGPTSKSTPSPWDPPFTGTSSKITIITRRLNTWMSLWHYAGGDWSAYSQLDSNTIVIGGCYVNLCNAQPKSTSVALNLNFYPQPFPHDAELPPAILAMTGTKDFAFTPEEQQTLRKHLSNSGVLWIDNGSGKKRSEFDLAVRREVAKLFPKSEPQFVIIRLPAVDDTPRIDIECFELNGSLAIAYTSEGLTPLLQNVYSDKLTKPEKQAYAKAGVVLRFLMGRWDEPMRK